ncbi:MAG: glycoside hydrolase family 3 N-terminal domain-containing protein [Eubacteriales bacterium]|nr:glycoside hydrolase family 3 N-terminal domain-containing protein [Eubacteriales bacterium]
MKKILSLLLAFLLTVCFPVSAFAEESETQTSSTQITATDEKKEKTIDERAKEILNSMTLEEKVAQMFMVYMPSENATSIQKKYQFGGYLLFANNFKNNSYKKKQTQIKNYQKASKIKMLIAVDEEGGIVNRVSLYKQYHKSPFLSPRELYKKGGYNKIKKDTREKANLLLDLGINTNLAPVADVAYKSSNYIYSRSFSTSAKSTSKYIDIVVTEMGKKNLVSTLKHFPGYGNNGDTHNNIIRDKRSKKTFVTRDLLPFQSGIDAGCDMIMVSHNIVECFDKKNPASLSKKVHSYIRKEMNFDGVIISDGLGMAGVVDFVGGSTEEAAVRSVLAGNDMICANNYKVQYPAVLKAVKKGRIKESQINKSVLRILKLKLNRKIIK